MRVVASAVWHQDRPAPVQPGRVCLADMLPQAGHVAALRLPEYELRYDATLHLLWCPPYSEQNGWDEQPSEIASSQIVSGRLLGTAQSAAAPRKTTEVPCGFAVEGRVPFLEFMRANARASAEVAPSMPIGNPLIVWRNVRWCGTAEIGDFTYVSALSGEAQAELILRRRGGGMIVNYAQLSVDGWGDAAVGAWEIEDSLRQLIEHRLQGAEVLLDKAPAYLE